MSADSAEFLLPPVTQTVVTTGPTSASAINPAPTITDIALDASNDLALDDDGLLHMVDGAAYVAQSLCIRLKHFRGEWFRDLNAGTDWYGRILGKASDLSRRAEIRARILGTPNVRALTRLDVSLVPTTRMLSIDFEVQLETGDPVSLSFEVAA